MKKMWLALLVAMCLMATLTACGENNVPSSGMAVVALPEPTDEQKSILNAADSDEFEDILWAAVPAVFVNDEWYRIYDERQEIVPELTDEWVYIGDIQSIAPAHEPPTENFQANFGQLGARLYRNNETRIPVKTGSWLASIDEEVIGDGILVEFEDKHILFVSETAHDEVMEIMNAVERDSLMIDESIYSLMGSSSGDNSIDLDKCVFIGEVKNAVSVYELPGEHLQGNREYAIGAKVYRLPEDHKDDIIIFHFPGSYNYYTSFPYSTY